MVSESHFELQDKVHETKSTEWKFALNNDPANGDYHFALY